MAKYQIIIDGDDADDLVSGVLTLASLLGGAGEAETADAAPTARPRRGRPPKADAGAVTPPSSAPASQEPSSPAAGSDAGPTATTSASPSEGGALTKEAVMNRMSQAMDAIGSPEALIEKLKAEGIPGRLSEIMAEGKQAEAMKVFDTVIATS